MASCSTEPRRSWSDATIAYFQGGSLDESPNANGYRKPLGLSRSFDLYILTPEDAFIPEEIASVSTVTQYVRTRANRRKRHLAWRDATKCLRQLRESIDLKAIVTKIDGDSCLFGLWAKRQLGLTWIMCCWDHPYPVQEERSGFHNYIVRRVRQKLVQHAMRQADLTVLNIHPGLLTHINAGPRRLLSLPNGVDSGHIHSVTRGIAPKPGLLGVVANVDKSKGTLDVLRAFVKIHDAAPDARLRLIGAVSDDFAESLRTELKSTGLSDFVDVTGWRPYDEAMKLAAECSVLLFAYPPLPRFRWNYVLKLGEYCAMGRPIVAVDTPGSQRYVRPTENGILVPPQEPDSIADAVLSLLHDETRCAAMGKASLAVAEAHDWQCVEGPMHEEIRNVVQMQRSK